MNSLKKLMLCCLTLSLLLSFQITNAQGLKAAAEQINSFTQWATSPGVVMVEGDFNGDGRGDIALVRQTNGWGTIPIAFSTGDGSFIITNEQVPQFTRFAVAPTYVIHGDFNGDGRDDIALIGKKGSGWGSIPIAFSNGDGTFSVTNKQADRFYQSYLSASSLTTVSGDYNGDGNCDMAFFSQSSAWEKAPIAISNGDGTFSLVEK